MISSLYFSSFFPLVIPEPLFEPEPETESVDIVENVEYEPTSMVFATKRPVTVKPEPEPEAELEPEPEPEPKPDKKKKPRKRKPSMKMKKSELIEAAEKMGIEIPEGATKKVILDLIYSKKKK